ncbi:alpha/beta hydrolase [Limnovirga soli]|uniref:Prolyl oligopeptidase family serine peptidase n=1 Tax=Limnovirga soli TaxID=2656915 RepID=A0A8J8FFZ6_9BACT|nr:alpha/beta hydrolase [Limnovirga soli]NNV55664.1 prolyl oligopeptidase family serine peptidase [Limnovirga soli]
MKKLITAISYFMFMQAIHAQQVFSLYDGAVPNAIPCNAVQKEFIDTSWNKSGLLIVQHVTTPTITVYQPAKEKQNGTAVLICPGGGYGVLAAGHEGAEFAKIFNDNGITAFVLYYRLPDDACMTNKAYVPLMDAQQGLYFIRSHAAQYNINVNKVGIMGFSAGGHLAASASVHFNDPVRKELAGANLRPDFSLLIYPVISFKEEVGHMGSRNNLIGNKPTAAMTTYFSNEDQITDKTPPAFLVHASDDGAVKPENSILYYQSLISHNIQAEMHIYQNGGHGFGLHNPTTNDQWFDRCLNWLKANKLL